MSDYGWKTVSAAWHCLLAVLAGVLAQAAPVQAAAQAYTISGFDLTAPGGRVYRISTAVPADASPASPLPVVYLIDGNTTFPLAQAVLAKNPDLKAVIVGIGYPTDDAQEIIRLRYIDLTPPTAPELIPTRDGAAPPETGGRDAFLAFLDTQLKPEIERRFAVDTGQQSLFGHSLGGHLALSLLYNHTPAFQTYIAADPAIWWNGGSILKDQERFIAAGVAKDSAARLLIETAGARAMRPGTDAAAAEKLTRLRSGPNGKAVVEALATVDGLHIAFHSFPDESHGTMIPLAIADALAFALRRQDPAP